LGQQRPDRQPNPVAQSFDSVQRLPAPHGAQPPPQSTSVSVPSVMRSAHELVAWVVSRRMESLASTHFRRRT